MYENRNNKSLVWPQEIQIDPSLSVAMLAVEHTEKVFALIDQNRDYLSRWLPWVDETRCVDDTRSHIMTAPV
ncbi:hypothetical protein F6A13_14060 [Acidithiobacillus sp. 'AMD consortium']|uniref:hypothetical protein n=1 Tax=Acidithiobacillus sp. 'AMD consortium' TaxID=2614801 RepID=UPI00124D6568|nr:hypothetical protein [Acidithiobacillus sp. 'AMD consortium']QFG79603.1 hypothetical protein F6A13_14060 [Acidithiobacillus sp. 'AMD consortium']